MDRIMSAVLQSKRTAAAAALGAALLLLLAKHGRGLAQRFKLALIDWVMDRAVRKLTTQAGGRTQLGTVRTDTDGPVRIITIDRPEVRNAVDRPTADALAAAFRDAESDDDVRVIILTGAEGYFCVGADLKGVSDGRGNRVLDHQLARMVLQFAWHLTSVTWIVLAVILYALAFDEPRLQTVILGSVGLSFAAVGLFDLVVSRGRHIGWPPLLLTGVFALAAMFYG